MKRLSFWAAVIGVWVLAVSVVTAQGQGRGGGRGQGPQYTNLQILPATITQPQLVQVMQAFTTGLGVGCNYCHVTAQDGPRGGAAPMNDFASDAKPAKGIARTMMLTAREVNAKFDAELGKPAAEITDVQCVTCHRGVPIPKQLVDIVLEADAPQAGLARYQELRKQFHGSASYDFSDFTLFRAAQLALAAMPARPGDALAFLQANVEMFPNSARSYQQMSVAYQRQMDTPNAIAMLERAVEIEPMNMQYRNQLNNLRNPPAPQQ